MRMIEHNFPLTEHNFLNYCIKNYDNPNCTSIKDFQDDLKHRKYIKKLLNKYNDTGELKDRHILNHIIILNNVFGSPATAKIIFYKLEKSLYPAIKTFLLFLGLMPDQIRIETGTINNEDIDLDLKVVECLRKI